MKIFRLSAPVLLALVLTLLPAATRAQDASINKGKVHFNKGQEMYRLGQFRRALAEYQEALKLVQRPSIILNMAQCYRNLDQPKKAVFFYKLYLSEWRRQHPAAAPLYEDEVKVHIKSLTVLIRSRTKTPEETRPAVKAGKLQITGVRAARALLLVDGEVRSMTPFSRPVEVLPGRRVVRVEADGHLSWKMTLTIKPGEDRRLHVQLALLPQRDRRWLIPAIIAAVIATGAEAFAIGYTVAAQNHIDGSAPHKDDRDRAIVGHVLAGTFAAVSVTTLVIYLRSGRVERGGPTKAAAVLPVPGGVAAGLTIHF